MNAHAHHHEHEHDHADAHEHAARTPGHDHLPQNHPGQRRLGEGRLGQDHIHHHPARRADPGVSLLRMSSAQRLVIALALVAAIWLGVVWAWS